MMTRNSLLSILLVSATVLVSAAGCSDDVGFQSTATEGTEPIGARELLVQAQSPARAVVGDLIVFTTSVQAKGAPQSEDLKVELLECNGKKCEAVTVKSASVPGASDIHVRVLEQPLTLKLRANGFDREISVQF